MVTGPLLPTSPGVFASLWLLLVCLLPWGTSRADSSRIHSIFEKHCNQCHGANDKVKGDVDLAIIGSLSDLRANPDLLQSVIDVIEFGEMPPEGEPPISEPVLEEFVADLDLALSQSLSGRSSFPETPIRRMNRFQYHNAVTDLFDLKNEVFTLPERMMREYQNYFDPATGRMPEQVTVGSRPLGKSQLIEKRLGGVTPFPQDLRAEHGFENRADHLSLSPLLMEAFLKLGRSITGSPDFTSKTVGTWDEFFAPPRDTSDLAAEVRKRLAPFLGKAFRRPSTEEELDRYTAFAESRLRSGQSFTPVMKSIAAATLASPKFLYLYDRESPGDHELASRLSFFLWGSIPDNELLASAASGELGTEKGLREQFHRMLNDEKLKRFCDSFPSQWLQLDRIISSIPDPDLFPDFYFSKYRDSMHMMLEPLLIFETVLIENQSILQLIDSDFTYRSDLLREAYGLPEIERLDRNGEPIRSKGSAVTTLKFFREPVEDRRYGGVITNAAVMTMTSGPRHTHPITRGAWMAGVIFRNPPEPPPADVPPLDEKPRAGEENLTLRERLAAHRERSDCSGCHQKIDPLGFALENYDPIGRWREQYENGRDIDVSGSLFRKHRFDDIEAFKDSILEEKDRFTRAFAGHLLSFALARELEPVDEPVLDGIVETARENEYRIRPLLEAVVMSRAFTGTELTP